MNYKKVELPSKLLTYKDVEEIKLRSLTGNDEKIIAYSNPSNLEVKFVDMLKTVVDGIDPLQLTFGDRTYLLLYLTVDSYGKEYGPVSFYCDNCFQEIHEIIDLNSFDVIKLPENFKQPYEVKLSTTSVYLRLLTVADEIKVLEKETENKNAWLYRYALTMVDQSKNIVEKEKFLENLSLKDLALIKAFHRKFEHGPDMVAKYKCPLCGGEGRVSVPFRFEMLFPNDQILTDRFGAFNCLYFLHLSVTEQEKMEIFEIDWMYNKLIDVKNKENSNDEVENF
jgi:hypothetical protein